MELITAINTLPADVLLEIFNVYVIDGVVEDGLDNVGTRVSTLANCRFVFQSPRHRNLRLVVYTQNACERHPGWTSGHLCPLIISDVRT